MNTTAACVVHKKASVDFSFWEDVNSDSVGRIVDILTRDKSIIIKISDCLECEISLSENGNTLTDVIYNQLMFHKGASHDRPSV